MSALATRAHIHNLNQHYLCPLAQIGDTAKEMETWVEAANSGNQQLQPVYVKNEKGKRVLLAEGYVFERTLQAKIAPREAFDTEPEQTIEWTEQVFVARSESYRKSQLNGLEGRLQRATTKLLALTPPPARGKHQIQAEAELVNAATAILKAHHVEGLLTYTFERQEKRETKYIGRGPGNPERPTRGCLRSLPHTRCHPTGSRHCHTSANAWLARLCQRRPCRATQFETSLANLSR